MSEGRQGRQGRRWTVTDARGNPIYLTEERWEHICIQHPGGPRGGRP